MYSKNSATLPSVKLTWLPSIPLSHFQSWLFFYFLGHLWNSTPRSGNFQGSYESKEKRLLTHLDCGAAVATNIC